MFLSFFKYDLRNAIQLAKFRGGALIHPGEFCFRAFLSVISVTYPILQN